LIIGGAANDVLSGEEGSDTLSGGTGQTASMKAAVYLQTSDIQDAQGRVDPLALEQWYLTDTNFYQKRSSLRAYLSGCRHKRLSKCAKNSSKRPPDRQNNFWEARKIVGLGIKYVVSREKVCSSSY
jgi:hypothetical protein